MSGKHSEYYTHYFYYKYLNNLDTSPFKLKHYNDVSGEDYPPCIILGNWNYLEENYSIWVFYEPSTEEYEITFSSNSKEFHPDLIEILGNNKFLSEEPYFTNSLPERKAVKLLKSLFESLNSLENE
jgi:hypothetical protein